MGDNRSTPSMSFLGHMLAGAAAGTVEHVAMYPVDTIKTRMQALSHPGQQLNASVFSAMKTAIQRNGLGGLYRGVSAMAFGAGPAHALYFATYEAAKEAYGGNRQGHQVVATALAGATATIVNDAVMTPADVVKQRLQLRGSPYKGLSDCVVGTWRKKGLAAFFRSYPTTLLMNVPFTAIHFAAYESGKKLLRAGDEETLATELIAGGVAGGLAAAATTPLDVAKTRLQTEGVRSAKTYETVSSVRMMRRIAMEEGSAALWRGLEARVLFHVPSAAVCWATYETVKGFLHVR